MTKYPERVTIPFLRDDNQYPTVSILYGEQNPDQLDFNYIGFPLGAFGFEPGSRVLYSHCSTGMSLDSLLESHPGIKITLNDLYPDILDTALRKIGDKKLMVEATVPGLIEDLPEEYSDFDATFSYEPYPISNITFLLYLTRTKSDGKLVGVSHFGWGHTPHDLFTEASKIYGAEFTQKEVEPKCLDERGQPAMFRVTEVLNNSEALQKANNDLAIVRKIYSIIAQKNQGNPPLSTNPNGEYDVDLHLLVEELEGIDIGEEELIEGLHRLNELSGVQYCAARGVNVYFGQEK
jgi:hypothetical protein